MTSSSSAQPNHLVWFDAETTDTDPYAHHAAFLEIGAIITRWDPELTEVARARLVIRPPGTQADHDMIWARMHPVVRDMHTTNGLWQEATVGTDAWAAADVDRGLTDWLTSHVGDERLPLAGSGVGHLDLPWVKAYLPLFASRLTYWPLDIGGTRRMLDLAGRSDLVDLPGDVEAKPHRGLEDVEMHVAEARRYLGLIRALPTPVAP
jgi:oligoribonuclease (3'-5' exoribonuclease)